MEVEYEHDQKEEKKAGTEEEEATAMGDTSGRGKRLRASRIPTPPKKGTNGVAVPELLLARLWRQMGSLRERLARPSLSLVLPTASCAQCGAANPAAAMMDGGADAEDLFRCRQCFELNCTCEVCETQFVSKIPHKTCPRHRDVRCGKCGKKTLQLKTGTKLFECSLCYVEHVSCYGCEKIILRRNSISLPNSKGASKCQECANKRHLNMRRKR